MSRHLALFILAAALALPVSPGSAQTVTNSFKGLSGNAKEPIDIESDLLVVHDKDKFATFSGNVKAIQGTTTLRSRRLDVHYVGGDKLSPGSAAAEGPPAPAADIAAADAKTAAADGDTKITKIEAKGDVIITSKEDGQTTKSDWALYDLPAQLVTVGGNVVLTQGENVLKGERLVIDLKTGESRFENPGSTASGGRIRALFMPKGGPAKDAKSDEKSGDGKPDHEDGASDTSGQTFDAGPPDRGVADDAPLPIDPFRRGAQ
jgi:lipopolysaccharide export system protein LptA